MLTLQAPAKLNLTLEVLAKRPDGFHEIRSVLQTIALCDSLRFGLSQKVEFSCDDPAWAAEKSLVSRVVNLVRENTGCPHGVMVNVNKRVPLVSGLGGDSSDAAATLRGLNELWGLGLSRPELVRLATQLGSDVAFFVYGGTALAEGRGETVTPLPPLAHMWVVLVVLDVPRLPGKTQKLYASLKASHYTGGQITENFVKALKEDRGFKPSMLFNTFENVAFDRFFGLKVYKEHFIKLGAPHVYLAGSGPALFTMLEDKAQAEDLYTRCQQQGMETYLVETLESIIE